MEQGLTDDSVKSQKDTVQKIATAFTALDTRFAKFRRDALRNYRYVVGDQISPDVKAQLDEEHRPALVFNLLQPLIIYLAGVLSSNQHAMKATPLRFGDELLAELHTVLVSDFAMEGCDGYEEIVKAALDAIIAKVGWVNNHWSTRRNPEGEWITESADPMMIMWDPDGRKEDQTDWRYQCVSAFYGAEEIIAIYGDSLSPEMVAKIRESAQRLEGAFRKLGQPVGWLDRVINGVVDGVREMWSALRGAENIRDERGGLLTPFMDARNGLYRVVEWHEKRAIIRKWVYSPVTRDKMMIPPEKESDQQYVDSLMQQMTGAQIKTVTKEELWRVVCAPGLLPDDVIMEKPYQVQEKGFQHKPIFCYSFHKDLLQTASVADSLISPQDSYNQRRMTMLEYIMDTLNPKWNYPQDSIATEDLPAWQSKERGTLKPYMPIGGLKPEPERPTLDRQALEVFQEEDRDLVQKISGITPNLQGYKESSNEPAALFRARVQQGQTMLAYFNSHVLRAMKHIFRYCDASLQEFMTLPRQVRLLSEPPEGMQGVQKITQGDQDTYWLQVNWPTLQGMINDVRQGEYDFNPDFTQLGETARQMKFIEMMEFIGKIAQIDPASIDVPALFELWDSPVSEKMGKFAQAVQDMKLRVAQQQAQLQQAAQKAALIGQAADIKNKLNPVEQAQQRAA